MILLWAAFICLCASATGKDLTYQTSFIEGPFNKKFGRRDYISGRSKINELTGSIFCVVISGNKLEECEESDYDDHRVILQLDAYNYKIPAHRTPELVQWRPVTNYDQTFAFAVVIAPKICSVHSPSLSSKRHYNIRCTQREGGRAGLRIYRRVKPVTSDRDVKPNLIIPVYAMNGPELSRLSLSGVHLIVTHVDEVLLLGIPQVGKSIPVEKAWILSTEAEGIPEGLLEISFGVDDHRLPHASKELYYTSPMAKLHFKKAQGVFKTRIKFPQLKFTCCQIDIPSPGQLPNHAVYCVREHEFDRDMPAGLAKLKVSGLSPQIQSATTSRVYITRIIT